MNHTVRIIALLLALVLVAAACGGTPNQGASPSSRTADHTVIHELMNGRIVEAEIQHARETLHIAYGHTSHGSQITSGMSGLVTFANDGGLGFPYSEDLFRWSHDGTGSALHLFEGDGYGDGPLDHDAGYYPNWVAETRAFLDDPENAEFNVILWSWCGQVSGLSEAQMISNYLQPMAELQSDYPGIVFVYMTGHLDGTGPGGNLHQRNQQIREHCTATGAWLFDFADIESYDPDGRSYLDRMANDACDYDSDGNGSRDANWAIEWQAGHTEGIDWYECSAAHSQPLNANMKAYAAWWLFTQIAADLES